MIRYIVLLLAINCSANAAEDGSLDSVFGFTNEPPKAQPKSDTKQQNSVIASPVVPPKNSSEKTAATAVPPVPNADAKQNNFFLPKPNTVPDSKSGLAASKPEVRPVAVPSATNKNADVAPVKKVQPLLAPPVVQSPIVNVPTKPVTPQAIEIPKVAKPEIAKSRQLAPEKPDIKSNPMADTTAKKADTVTTKADAIAIKKIPMMPATDLFATDDVAPVQNEKKSVIENNKKSVVVNNEVQKNISVHKKPKKLSKLAKKPELFMTAVDRGEKTRKMLDKNYKNLTIAITVDFRVFSSELSDDAKNDLADKALTIGADEVVALYGSSSIGAKGSANAARAVAESRMKKVADYLESKGIKRDQIVIINKSETLQDKVDVAFVVIKDKR